MSETLDNMVLVNGRQSGQFTKMPGYPDVPACVKECCKVPTCDLIFKSGEVCITQSFPFSMFFFQILSDRK